ncbi:MAG: ribonuclease III family protein [Bacteroidota bacterium]
MPLLPRFFTPHTPRKDLQRRLRSLTGLRIRQIELYELAFTHPLVHGQKTLSFHSTNQRLEFLGDAVLDLVVADYLFRKFPFKQEGFLTEMRSKVVNGEFLDRLGRQLGLDQILKETSLRLADEPESAQKNRHLDRQLTSKGSVTDAFEAFVGALYLDTGFMTTKQWLESAILDQQIDWEELEQSGINPKSRLLEWAQKHRASYRLVCEESETTHRGGKATLYSITLWVNGKAETTAQNFNKRKAEQEAAALFFEQRGQNEGP